LLGPREEEIPLLADTLWIDTDDAVVTLTWRGYLSFDRPPPRAAILVVAADRGAPGASAGTPASPVVLHATGRLNPLEMTQTDTDPLHLAMGANPPPFVTPEREDDDLDTLATKLSQVPGAEAALALARPRGRPRSTP